MKREALVGLSMAMLVGCQFTVPQPPTTTERIDRTSLATPSPDGGTVIACPPSGGAGGGGQGDVRVAEYSFVSPVAGALACYAVDGYVRRQALDAAFRCENRLAELTAKMRRQRDWRAGMAITGGILAATSTAFTASLDRNDTTEVKVTTAALAGVGAISVLASQTIGDPAEALKLYTSALREYERAADVTRSMFAHYSDQGFFSAVGHFERCASISEAGSSSSETDKKTVEESVRSQSFESGADAGAPSADAGGRGGDAGAR
jgi:hypothetical protein